MCQFWRKQIVYMFSKFQTNPPPPPFPPSKQALATFLLVNRGSKERTGKYVPPKKCCNYSLCFTRLPLKSLPSARPSFPSLLLILTECSLTLATYSNNSVSKQGQLSFKYSKPSVCITATERKKQTSNQTSFSKLQTFIQES